MTESEQRAIEGADPDDAGTLEVFPPARPPAMAAIATLREHVAAMRDFIILADGWCQTDYVPLRFRNKPKDAAAAMMLGAEVGLMPMASLRSIIVIHGMPGFEARTMKAVLITHGYRFRTIEKTATRAEIWAWRPNSARIYDDNGQRINPNEVGAWTIEEAVRAGYVPVPLTNGKGYELNANGKLKGNMKYLETPRVMLEAKATAEVCRSIAPHILLGLPYAAEEIDELVADDGPPAQEEGRRGRGVNALRDRARAAKAAKEPAADVVDAEEAEIVADGPVGKGGPDGPGIGSDWRPGDPLPDGTPTVVSDYLVTAVEGTTGEDLPGTMVPDIEPEPTPEQEPEPVDGAGLAADKGGEGTAANGTPPPAPPADDIEMTSLVRRKGLNHMHALLLNGGVTEEEDGWAAVSEIMTKRDGATYRPIRSDDDLTDTELKHVAHTLFAWKNKGKLEAYLNEALNAASLREAGQE